MSVINLWSGFFFVLSVCSSVYLCYVFISWNYFRGQCTKEALTYSNRACSNIVPEIICVSENATFLRLQFAYLRIWKCVSSKNIFEAAKIIILGCIKGRRIFFNFELRIRLLTFNQQTFHSFIPNHPRFSNNCYLYWLRD
jgi:hypothetical protein